jgi:hypothetical protein
MNDLAHRSEGDTDLHGDGDAQHWAERFMAVRQEVKFKHYRDIADEEGTMLAWFANAIETGRMVESEAHPFPGVTERAAGTTGEDIAEDPADVRPKWLKFFDQYGHWWTAADQAWPPNGQWCARHWSPCPCGQFNGIGASVAMMEAFATSNDLLADDMPIPRDPESLNRAMKMVVEEFGAICCALGDQEMYRIWQDWPHHALLPNQQVPTG